MATETEKPPQPRELGWINPGNESGYGWGQGMQAENVPELQWPQCLSTWNRMRKSDSQVATLLKAITLPIMGTPWRIDPAGASDEVADFIAEQLDLPKIGAESERPPTRRRHRFTWSEHLRLALLAVPFGAMFFEQVVEQTPDGKWGLRKLAPRMPWTLSDILVARDGGLVGIEQQAPSSMNVVRASDAYGPVRIPVDRLVAYSYGREGGNWAGESLLRPCYPNWYLKDQLLRVEATAIKRNGLGVPVYENPEGASDAQIEKGRQMAESYQAGDGSGASLPPGAKLSLIGVQGQIRDPRKVIEYHDAQIGRVGLAHFLNLDGQGGSYALASTQADLFTQSLSSVAQLVADTATQHIVADLVDWNFGKDEPIPRVVFDDLRSTSLDVANALRTLTDAGLIRPDRSIEEWLRREMGAPAKDTPPPEQTWNPDEESETADEPGTGAGEAVITDD